MPEQQSVADEAVQAAQTLLRRRVGYNEFCNRAEADAADMALLGPVVEAAAPFIRAPLEAENTRLREAGTKALRARDEAWQKRLDEARAQVIREVVEHVTEVINEASMRGHAVPDAVGMLDIILRTFGGDRA